MSFDLRHPVPQTEDFADRMADDSKRHRYALDCQKDILSAQIKVLRDSIPPRSAYGGVAERLVMGIGQRELRVRMHQLETTGICHFNGPQMLKIAMLFGVGMKLEFCPFEETVRDRRAIDAGGKLDGLQPLDPEKLRRWLAE